jgi:hypothetical protein
MKEGESKEESSQINQEKTNNIHVIAGISIYLTIIIPRIKQKQKHHLLDYARYSKRSHKRERCIWQCLY